MQPRVLIACEFSGIVREAMRNHGAEAWSCDLIPALDGSPFHLQKDARKAIVEDGPWDLMIAHPNCDRLLGAGALHWEKWRSGPEFEQQKAIVFFMEMALAKVPRVAVENPRGIMSTIWRKPDQTIQPWMFGHMESKATCLWLRELPLLQETANVYEAMMRLPKRERERVHYESPGTKNGLTRSQRRSIFFPGIADAMALQWLPVIRSQGR